MYLDLYYMLNGVTRQFIYPLAISERVLSLDELLHILSGYMLKLTDEESNLLRSNYFQILSESGVVICSSENVDIYPEMLVFN